MKIIDSASQNHDFWRCLWQHMSFGESVLFYKWFPAPGRVFHDHIKTSPCNFDGIINFRPVNFIVLSTRRWDGSQNTFWSIFYRNPLLQRRYSFVTKITSLSSKSTGEIFDSEFSKKKILEMLRITSPVPGKPPYDHLEHPESQITFKNHVFSLPEQWFS